MNCGYGYCNLGGSYGDRNFFTKKEKIDLLKKYKEDLDSESKGAAERIKELEERD